MTAPIPRWRNRIRPGRKQLFTDRSPLPPPPDDPNESGPRSGGPPPSFGGAEGLAGYLRQILDHLHLDRVDAGDLLLLGLLYFLFREKADEELLVALGLLLIL